MRGAAALAKNPTSHAASGGREPEPQRQLETAVHLAQLLARERAHPLIEEALVDGEDLADERTEGFGKPVSRAESSTFPIANPRLRLVVSGTTITVWRRLLVRRSS